MLLTERRDPQTLVMRIDREHARNAIDHDLTVSIEAALDELEDDPDLRAGVITGSARLFSAGTDIFETRPTATTRGGEYGLIRRRRRKVLIAAVEGLALGGGFEIVLSCDLVVAATDAEFGLPEARIGRIASSGALFRAPRALPRAVAVELLLGGGRLDAGRAFALGVVNRLAVPGRVVEEACALAALVCRSSPDSVAAMLEALAAVDEPVDELGWQATATARSWVMAGANATEGTQAFREKRAPVWTTGRREMGP